MYINMCGGSRSTNTAINTGDYEWAHIYVIYMEKFICFNLNY